MKNQTAEQTTEQKLFNSKDKELKKGSVVEYNGKKYLFWNNNNGKAQLINTDGTKFSGTPNIDKLIVLGSYKTIMYNNTEYIVTDNGNIYSGATGNLVYTGEDNSSKVQKMRILEEAKRGFTSDKKASTSNDIILNVEQKKAFDEIMSFIKDPSKSTHALIGYAGTGKTTLLNSIKKAVDEQYPDRKIIFSSPTHRANTVIKLKNPKANVQTLHSLLGLQPNQDLDIFDAKRQKH